MIWPKRKTSIPVRRLERKVAELQSKLDAAERIIKVLEAERDTLAAVVARDRARIEAEGAAYARQRAEHEGTNERPGQGIHSYSA